MDVYSPMVTIGFTVKTHPHMGVSINGGTPIAGCSIIENPIKIPLTWMIIP